MAGCFARCVIRSLAGLDRGGLGCMGAATRRGVVLDRQLSLRLFQQGTRQIQRARRMGRGAGLLGRLNRLSGIAHFLRGYRGAGREQHSEQNR